MFLFIVLLTRIILARVKSVERHKVACAVVLDDCCDEAQGDSVDSEDEDSAADELLQMQDDALNELVADPAIGEDITLYCYCRQKYDYSENSRRMILCNSCDGWFHGDCVHVKVRLVTCLKHFWVCLQIYDLQF